VGINAKNSIQNRRWAFMVKLNKLDEQILSVLKNSDKGLTLTQIAEKIGESEKKVFKSLRKLFENEIIDCENRQYKLVKP
jgi:DNA-binding Lrp family transcriptional regulator